MKFAVVGAGPVGLVSALHILRSGHEVDLISCNEFGLGSVATNWSNELKAGRFGLAAYGGDSDSNIDDLEHLFIESKVRGGYANVWGATWGKFTTLNSDEWMEAYNQVDKYVWSPNPLGKSWADFPHPIQFQCLCFEKPLHEVQLKNSKLIKESNLALIHNGCECIATGKTQCEHGSIFDTSDLLRDCNAFREFKLIESFKIESYYSSNGRFILSPQPKGGEYDRVILAAGPVANARILLNSEPSIDLIEVKDNTMWYVPLINLFTKKRHPGSFAFSQIQITSGSDEPIKFHLQIYAHPEIYSSRIESSFPRFLQKAVKVLLKFTSRRLNIGIIYLDQDVSSSAIIRRRTKIEVSKPEKRISLLGSARLCCSIVKCFLDLKFLWIIPFSKKPVPGASFHVGAIKGNILDDYGRLKISPEIGVAGAISLARLEPGPITNTSMAQAIRLINQMLNLPKSGENLSNLHGGY